jgi:hypothetical protein
MNTKETNNKPARLPNEYLLAWIFCIGSLFLTFRPPATWSEIFFLASLKRMPVTIAHEGPEFHLLLPDENIILRKSPYLPEWAVAFFDYSSSVLNRIYPALAESLTGGSALAASRITAVCLALCAAGLFYCRRKKSLPQESSFCAPVAPDFLLFMALPLFVRWGALEQLCVLVALVSFTFLAPAESRLRVDHRTEKLSALLFSLSMAAACSRTWSFSLICASVLWLLIESGRKLRLHRILLFSAAAVAVFVFLFLVPASFESLVSHWTQRWLYLNEPRYLPDMWIGDGLLWKLTAGLIGVLSARRLALKIPRQKFSGTSVFPDALALTSALHIALYQTVPVCADVLLLALVFFSTAKPELRVAENHDRLTRLLHRTVALLPALYLSGIVLALIVGGLLILSPATRLVPELQSAVDGFVLAVDGNRILSATLFVLAAAGPAIHLVAIAKSRSQQKVPSGRESLRSRSLLMHTGLLTIAAALLCATELRSSFVWDQLQRTLNAVPQGAQIFYLPKHEPLIAILPRKPLHMRLVTLSEGSTFLFNQGPSAVLVPSALSEVCRAAQWKVEFKNGIFALCDTGQGTIQHLLPLN